MKRMVGGLGGVLAVMVCLHAAPRPTQVSFHSTVDLASVDVQVLDRDGRPIRGLDGRAFEVMVDGKRAPVASFQFVDLNPMSSVAGSTIQSEAPSEPAGPAARQPGRYVLLAIDCQTFDPGLSKGIVEEAKRFVGQLQAADRVGLFAFPLGPKLDPTTDHAAIVRALDSVTGQRQIPNGEFANLAPSDLVDITAEMRGNSAWSTALKVCKNDGSCTLRLNEEATMRAQEYEVQAQTSVGMLKAVLRALRNVTGEKTLVLASAGVVVSDVVGGRPNVSDVGIEVGKEAAASRVTVYSLYFDQHWLEENAAQNRTARRIGSNSARDSRILGRWLEQAAGQSGGTLLSVQFGTGAFGFDRVLRETSGYYLLGVEVPEAARDGKPHQLKVRVEAKGATVRSRTFVTMAPKQ